MAVTYINRLNGDTSAGERGLYDMSSWWCTGIAFAATSGNSLDRITVSMKKTGSPTGNISFKLYATNGTPGANAEATGPALTTMTLDATTLTTSFATYTINCTSRVALGSSNYVLMVEYSSGSVNNRVDVRMQNDSLAGVNEASVIGGSPYRTNAQSPQIAVYGAGTNRYSVATGNWSSNSTWSDTSGGSAGVSPPVAGDTVFVTSGASITLTKNESCFSLLHTSGTLNISQYTLNISTIYQTYFTSGACVLNTGTGTVNINTSQSSQQYTILDSSQFTASGSGVIRVYAPTGTNNIQLRDINYGNIIVVLGASSNSTTTNVTGNPTFNSFLVKSQNSASHTISFSGNITAKKAVFIGPSGGGR